MYSADNRFVRGPYKKFAYPNDVYYPSRVFPKTTIRYGVAPIKKINTKKINTKEVNTKEVNTSSLKSITDNIIAPEYQKLNIQKPYVFRHTIPPTCYEMWDYNKKDMSEYNEALRSEIEKEVISNPGNYKKVRR